MAELAPMSRVVTNQKTVNHIRRWHIITIVKGQETKSRGQNTFDVSNFWPNYNDISAASRPAEEGGEGGYPHPTPHKKQTQISSQNKNANIWKKESLCYALFVVSVPVRAGGIDRLR